LKNQDSNPSVDFLPILPTENYDSELEQADLPLIKMALDEAQKLARGKIILTVMPRISDKFLHPYYFDLEYPFKEGCDDFWQVFRILADGTVSPCLNLVVGNIKDQAYEDIWNGRKMQQLRQMISKGLFPGCMRCCHRYYLGPNRAF
jgi:MoaA/NifB/PqqE/SkfB family radical SAM enzyme